jgi:hypothetical protein
MLKRTIAGVSLAVLLAGGASAQTIEVQGVANQMTATAMSATNLVTFVPDMVLEGISMLHEMQTESPQ